MATHRANQSTLQRQNVLASDAARHVDQRANQSPLQRQQSLARNAVEQQNHRANQSPLQRQNVLATNAARNADQRGNQSLQHQNAARAHASSARARRREIVATEERLQTGYEDNFMLPTRLCNPYYKNSKFDASRQENDWYNAIKSKKYFGFRNQSDYVSLELFWNRQCPNCGCRYLNTQSDTFITKCCRVPQEVSFPPEKSLTPNIRKAIKEQPAHMSANATTYNNILAFGATCVDNDTGGGFQSDFRGPASITIRGHTYHCTHVQSESKITSGIGVMFYEHSKQTATDLAREQNNRRMTDNNTNEIVNEATLQTFVEDCLQYNSIAQEVDSIGLYFRQQERAARQQRLPPRFAGFEVVDEENEERLPLPVPNLIQTINDSTTYLDIGIIKGDQINGERGIRFVPKGNNTSLTIKLESERLEPFSYPLLFSHGEDGWGKKCKPEVQINQYIMSKILKCEGISIPSLLVSEHRLLVNRFQAMARLGQVWIVDNVSRMIDMQLDFVRKNQARIRGGEEPNYDPNEQIIDGDEHAVPVAPRQHVLCPASVTGSRRHLSGRAKEALALAAHFGGSTEFTTLTANQKWREIQELLGEGQTAFDRPDIVAQVFNEKLKAFIANLKSGKYHGAKMVYVDIWDDDTGTWMEDKVGTFVPRPSDGESILDFLILVTEYQHRGSPHAHLVYRIRYAPEGPRRSDTAEQVLIMRHMYIITT